MDAGVLAVFFFVYLGMILGKIPGLALDRTGIALLGAIFLLASGKVQPEDAWRSIDVPTIALLLGLMVVSAQFRLGGFYAYLTHRLGSMDVSPAVFLGLLILCAGLLSAFLANDIVCLAMTPVLVEVCARRRLDPVPFLLALACAANVGSAATLIGNPQNMLIGQTLNLSFVAYLVDAGIPVILGLASVWYVVKIRARGNWEKETSVPTVEAPPFSAWQTGKGALVLSVLVGLFLFTRLPRDVLALAAAGWLLSSRRMSSTRILGLVDWHLLVLFSGLFVVNHVLAVSGNMDRIMNAVRSTGVDISEPRWLFGVAVVLSNLVSNMPATMLLLPATIHPMGGSILALASTLAGNLLLVGSIANIIVVEQAKTLGVRITWKDHARVGIPVTLVTLAFAAAWLWLRISFPHLR
ncbi:MAG: anion transporter [Deltaproteobacteria bacterium]|nr:anion transporter [Deltaproteobacteria bacterium]